jgi:hypothetical protein
MTTLCLLPYLQSWDGTNLALRLLLIPRVSPFEPLAAGAPSFAAAHLVLDVRLVAGLDALPSLAAPSTGLTVDSPAPVNAVKLFNELANQFQIDPAPAPANPRPTGTRIKKHLPTSYRAAAQYTGERTPLVFTDDTYACAIRAMPQRPYHTLPPQDPKVPWGKVLAAALRQPMIAEALGLVRAVTIQVSPKDFFSAGGWIYVTLAPASDAFSLTTNTDGLKLYSARVPALSRARSLFTPVLFPVAFVPPPGPYDDLLQEATEYDDGFAKVVHGAQPARIDPLSEEDDGTRPVKDAGIRLGWDDEQTVIWLNRQIDPSSAALDAPMGAFGYRVDARKVGETGWHSLCRGRGLVGVGAVSLGTFDGELFVEATPVNLNGDQTGDFWLPIYFTNWYGVSLVGVDTDSRALSGAPPSTAAGVTGVAPDLPLRYGTDYQFRVRLMDHTGGGPTIGSVPAYSAHAPIATVPFRRHLRPKHLGIVNPPPKTPDPSNPPTQITLTRPLLGYPEFVFTGAVADPVAALTADLPAAKSEGREVGLPDPDVTAVQITVEARGLAFDPQASDAGYQPIYQTTRAFPSDPAQKLQVDLSWVDVHDVDTLSPVTTNGPLPLPTSRDIRVMFAAMGREDPQLSYFAADDVRLGPPIYVDMRKNADDERGLFLPALPGEQLKAIFLQPEALVDANLALAQRIAGRGGEAINDVSGRLAVELGVVVSGLTLRAGPGRRLLLGCAPAVRHVLGPDAASLTFASKNDLIQHWLVALRLTLDRDWTWGGLASSAIIIQRDGQEVGRLQDPRVANQDALQGAVRSQTDFLFLDAIEPKPSSGAFPTELEPSYTLVPNLVGSPSKADPPIKLSVRLPITTPPAQTPRLISAGIALSPYQRSTDYSQTQPRERALWLEFDRPPDNPRDAYFARVLRYAPDPILLPPDHDIAPVPEAPLAIDPEPMRVIVPGQSDDRAGLDAMQELVPSTSPVHYLLPLPPGIHEDSPELFGFFTYELRVGHSQGWSTARGRFGAALRVSGVQHPAPDLSCTVGRNSIGITVSAPFADPVFNGRSLQPKPPLSQIWVLLYAQAEQADGEDRRNVLLSHKRAFPSRISFEQPQPPTTYGVSTWSTSEVRDLLTALGFSPQASLSCLAVELLPNGATLADPLGGDLGQQRILRVSSLTPVPAIC